MPPLKLPPAAAATLSAPPVPQELALLQEVARHVQTHNHAGTEAARLRSAGASSKRLSRPSQT